jgi:hypothetical protein
MGESLENVDGISSGDGEELKHVMNTRSFKTVTQDKIPKAGSYLKGHA